MRMRTHTTHRSYIHTHDESGSDVRMDANFVTARPPHDAHRRRVGRRASTPTITTDRRLARPCGEQKFGSLRACRMLCDVWTLARNARKLAFHPWARGRTAVVGSLCDAPIGSSTSSPATSQPGSSLDGSLLSMPHSVFCAASLGSLGWPTGPARTASGAMALLSTTSSMPVGSPTATPAAGPHGALLDGSLLSTPWTVTSASLLLLQPPPGPAPAASLRQCCLRLRHARRLAARVARGGPTWRAARRERAQRFVEGSLPH